MSREVRRVPLDWKHPVEHNPYWLSQRSSAYGRSVPASRLHGETERFIGLCDGYPDALADWEKEGVDLAERKGFDWTFSVRWHLTGYDDCSCHPGERGVLHPAYEWSEDGDTETPFTVRDEDHLHAHLTAQHEHNKPDPAQYMPVFDVPEDTLGWCLYATVSEGCPVTPAFATADELVDHLATVGQDWDQVPMRRAAAETLVAQGGSFGSMLVANGRLYRADVDADLIARDLGVKS